MTRSRATEFDQPLFEPPPQQPKRKPGRVKNAARAVCTRHVSASKTPIGLVRYGNHLYWREHYVNTYGSRRLCVASNAPLHAEPAEEHPLWEVPQCPCKKGSKSK